MIDITETMLPSTVMSDRSFDAQMASSAIPADSRSLFMHFRAGRARGLDRAGGNGGWIASDQSHPAYLPQPAYLPLVASTLTGSPSVMFRTELYGPVTTSSAGLRPSSTSKYL